MRWKIFFPSFVFLIAYLVSPGFSSPEEVDDLINNIERNLNVSQDFLLMRRLAHVETDFGENDQATYRYSNGGIWQISPSVHEYLAVNSSDPDVTSLLAEVQRSFGINCLLCNYNYSDPVRSALAARLYMQMTAGPNTLITIEEQAAWWSIHYHIGGNESMFTNKVLQLESNYSVKSDLLLDVWCMTDGSGIVDENDFQKSLSFTSQFAEELTTSCPNAQVGFSVCSQRHDVYSNLTSGSSMSSFKAKVSSATQPEVNTSRNVGYALQNTLNEGFNATYQNRPNNISQAIVIVCGGRSSDSLSSSLPSIYDAGLDVYAVTIGDDGSDDNQMLPEINRNRTLSSPSYANLRNSSFQRTVYDMVVTGSVGQRANDARLADFTYAVVCLLVHRDLIRERFRNEGILAPSYPEPEELEQQLIQEHELPEMNCSIGGIDEAVNDEENPEVLHQREVDAGRGEELFAQILQIFIGLNLRYDVSSYITNVLRLGKSSWKIDLWLLLDGSRNVSHESFLSILNFSSSLVANFENSPQVKIGCSVFDESNHIIVGFDEVNKSTAIQSAVLSAKRQKVTKVTGMALRQIRDDGFSLLSGARPLEGQVHRVIVLVTVGGATDDVTTASSLIHDDGFVVFVIGIGSRVDEVQSNEIASKPPNKYFFHLKNFDELEAVMITLLFYRMNRFYIEPTTTTTTRFTLSSSTPLVPLPPSSSSAPPTMTATSTTITSSTATKPSTSTAPETATSETTSTEASTTAKPTAGVVVGVPVATTTNPVAYMPATFSSMVSVIQSRIAKDPNENVPGEQDFQSGSDTSFQTGILVSLLLLFTVAVATAFIVVKKRSRKISDEEASLDMCADKVLRELRIFAERAREPGASTTCFNKLFEKLSAGDRLGVSDENLRDPYDALFELKSQHSHITKEIALIVEESNKKPAEKGLLHRLQKQLYMAERALLGQKKLTAAYATLEDLYNHLKINRTPHDHEKLMRELRLATQNAKDEQATTECMHHLQKKLEAAEQVYVDPTRLVESYEALDNLKHGLYTVLDDLNEFTFEAKHPDADLACVLNLQKQLDLAEGLLITEKHLKVPYEVLEELKRRLNAMKHLHDLTEIALGPTATPYCLRNLEKEIDVAMNLGVGEGKIHQAEEAAELLRKRLKVSFMTPDHLTAEKRERLHDPQKGIAVTLSRSDGYALAKDDLKAVIHESKSLKAGHVTLEKLRTSLDLLKHLQIPEDLLGEGRDAFEMLKKRLKAMDELKHFTSEASQSTASRTCLEKLQELLEIMEDFHFPEEQLKASYDACYNLMNKLQELDELDAVTAQAKKPHSDRHVLVKLKLQLQTCVDLDISPDKLQEGFDTAEVLARRVEVLEGLQDLTAGARNPASGRSCLINLQNQIKMAEEEHISFEMLEDARRSEEVLKLRIKVLDEVNSLAEEANITRTVSKVFFKKLQKHIELAKSLKIPENMLKTANDAFTLLKKQLEVLGDLKATTIEAKDPNASEPCVRKLEKIRSDAIELHLPEEHLKESHKVLEMLNRRLKTMNELEVAVMGARQPRSGRAESVNLKKHIQEAEALLIPQSQLREAYEVMNQLISRIAVRKKLSTLMEDGKIPTATQSQKNSLQECIYSAQDLEIPDDELIEPRNTLILLEQRLTARDQLRQATEEARDPSSSSDCAEKLHEAINEVKNLGIPLELISDSYQALEILKKRIRIVHDLKPITEDADHPNADYLAMKRLRKQLDLAEVLRIPRESTESSNNVFKKLFERIEGIKDSLMERKLEASQPYANVYTLRNMKEQIDYAESLHIPPEECPEAYKAYKLLQERDEEVNSLIIDLRAAISNVDSTFMRNTLQRAMSSADLRSWNPEDSGWKDLLMKAEDVQGTLILRDATKSSLEHALNVEDVDPDELEEKIHRFELYVDMEIDSPDRQFVFIARKKLIDITRYRVLLKLQRAIGMRSNGMLREALKYKNTAFETKLKGCDLEKDPELVRNIEKAEELLALFSQLERMKSVVMSLKQPTISEIRSYSHPPVDIRKVMEATYILLGEDKKNVENWPDIQVLVGKIGKEALKRRIWERDLDDVSSHDAEVANETIANLKIEAVEELSKAASVFYCWSLCVIKEVHDRLPSNRRAHK